MNVKRAELIAQVGDLAIIADKESATAKDMRCDCEYAVVRGYKGKEAGWANAIVYTFDVAKAFAIVAEKLGNNRIKSKAERESGISYERMTEIATVMKDALYNSEDQYEIDDAMSILDMTDDEKEFFGIPEDEDDEDYEDEDEY